MRGQPGQRRAERLFNIKSLRDRLAQRHPVKAFVIVAGTILRIDMQRSLNRLLLTSKDTSAILFETVRTLTGIVSDATPTGNPTHSLLNQQRQAGFHRHANQELSVWR